MQDRAAYLEALGRADEARAARAEAARTPPAGARDHYLLALGHTRAWRYAKAVAELDRAVTLDPRHHWSWCLRGLCHQQLGEHTLTVADFSYCLGQAPEAWLYVNRAYSLYVLGQRADAIRDCDAALRLEPDEPMARWNRGLARLELQQYADALADLDAGKAAVRDEAHWSLNRGIALEGLGRTDEADAAFAAALAGLGAARAEVRALLLCRYAVAVTPRLPERAAEAFLGVLREDPDNACALYGLGAVLVLRGEAEAGLSRFDQAIEAQPDFIERTASARWCWRGRAGQRRRCATSTSAWARSRTRA